MAFTYELLKAGEINMLNMKGKLVDKAEAVEISVEIDEQLAEGANKFVVDLSELDYMNSTGLNIIINLMNKSRNEGGETIVAGAKPRIKALFDVTKLSSVFTMKESVKEAQSYFDQLA